jgi:hypothetical protein
MLLEIVTAVGVVGMVYNGQQGTVPYADTSTPGVRTIHLLLSFAVIMLPLWLPLPLMPAPNESIFGHFNTVGWIIILAGATVAGIARSR